MRVSILTSAHSWDDPRVFEREARALAAGGHDVRLFAPGAPSISHSGVEIVGPSRPRRRIVRMSGTLIRLARMGVPGADVVHIHDPELLAVVAALSVRRRRPFLVYDVHEDYSEQLRAKSWIPRLLRPNLAAVLGWLERLAARRCDLVVAATPAIARRFRSDSTVIVENHPDVESLGRPQQGSDGSAFRIVHVGEMNQRRGAGVLVDALQMLPPDSAVVVEQIGKIKPPALFDRGSDRLEITGVTDHADALQRVSTADAGLLLFDPGPNHLESQPNKLFEYLAFGLPIVASDFPHWRRIVAGCAGCAVFVDPTDPDSVRDGLVEIVSVARRHNRTESADHARQTYPWSTQAGHLLDSYRGLAAAAPRVGSRELRRIAPTRRRRS